MEETWASQTKVFSPDKTIEEQINYIIESRGTEDERPFFILDLASVIDKVKEWRRHMPRVQPFYAVKCNPDPMVLRTLAYNGVNFDCASMGEIKEVLSIKGMESSRIIFAHPCKQRSHLTYAREQGVTMMTFDNEPELHKIAQAHPGAELLLRIVTDDSQAQCRLSCKFGAALADCPRLLRTAHSLGLRVIGCAFHVGSGQASAAAFIDSLQRVRKVFDMAAALGLPEMRLVDIGGGFPGSTDPQGKKPSFAAIAAAMRPVLDELFPPHIQIMSEPGRYFAHGAGTAVTNVMGKRVMGAEMAASGFRDATGEDVHVDYLYYINDGVYGSFNNIIYDHANHLLPKLLNAPADREARACTIFGPTCDGLDMINRRVVIPEAHLGEWIYYEEMGAYTVAAGSTFNGFERPHVYYVCHE